MGPLWLANYDIPKSDILICVLGIGWLRNTSSNSNQQAKPDVREGAKHITCGSSGEIRSIRPCARERNDNVMCPNLAEDISIVVELSFIKLIMLFIKEKPCRDQLAAQNGYPSDRVCIVCELSDPSLLADTSKKT